MSDPQLNQPNLTSFISLIEKMLQAHVRFHTIESDPQQTYNDFVAKHKVELREYGKALEKFHEQILELIRNAEKIPRHTPDKEHSSFEILVAKSVYEGLERHYGRLHRFQDDLER